MQVFCRPDSASARDGDDFNGGEVTTKFHDGFQPFLLWHDNVGYNQMRWVRLMKFKGLFAIWGDQNFIFSPFQELPKHFPDLGVIVDHEYSSRFNLLFYSGQSLGE